jgi:carboxypeptidase Q
VTGLRQCRWWLTASAAVCLVGAVHAQAPAASASPAWVSAYRDAAGRLISAARADDFAWQRLAELTDTFGNRFSGSENLTRAIAWAVDRMKRDGLDNVRTEKVMVPHWVRGAESAEIVSPPRHRLEVIGLGGTVPTPPGGVEADLVVVGSFEELRSRAGEVRGRIVLFNAPFVNYTETVAYRNGGARAAAAYGATAVLVRSIGPMGMQTLHTGSVDYAPDVPAIPAAAVSAEEANRLARLVARGERVRLRLSLESRTLPDVESANVIAEIVGRERPDEIVLLGAHLDSWDVGSGASDDAVGSIVTWEALRLMKRLGLRPRRTVRVVLFTNEENGVRGGSAYASAHAREASSHVFALESDSGVYAPVALGFSGTPAARAAVRDIVSLLAPLGFSDVISGGGGADIGPITQMGGTPTMAYIGDPGKFFPVHHSAADTVDRIPPGDVSRAAAAIAVTSYVIAEMPMRLPQ